MTNKNRLEVSGGTIVVEQRGRQVVLRIELPTRQDASAIMHTLVEHLENREEFALVLHSRDIDNG
jgi:ribosomal protein S10